MPVTPGDQAGKGAKPSTCRFAMLMGKGGGACSTGRTEIKVIALALVEHRKPVDGGVLQMPQGIQERRCSKGHGLSPTGEDHSVLDNYAGEEINITIQVGLNRLFLQWRLQPAAGE
jgi:hypothetical protein